MINSTSLLVVIVPILSFVPLPTSQAKLYGDAYRSLSFGKILGENLDRLQSGVNIPSYGAFNLPYFQYFNVNFLNHAPQTLLTRKF